ncbi:DUF1566 domain-containing protein [Psychromonas sp. GE-S-Ul-11]|uniref:Lcl domain-containing protein n=1 Tax=Psychromonas sp. GE-S-Ul-11 TaxID=3241170 RepID=UPI00390CA1BC
MIKIILSNCLILSALLAFPTQASQTLTATIIGSGSPIYNEKRASASVLISNGETNILVDMGNGTQANLHKLGVPIASLSSLLLTHHHLDHNEEFAPLLIGLLMSNHDFDIVGPENTTHFTEANLNLYQEDISYRLGRTNRNFDQRKKAIHLSELKGGEQFKIGAINVSTLAVPHTIATLAYRFDYDRQSIVVTGDLTYSKALPKFAKNADYMIIDSGGMVMSNMQPKKQKTNPSKHKQATKRAHLDLNDSSLLASQAGVKQLVYTHFLKGEVDTKESLKQIRKNYQGPVIFGEDLMVVNQVNKTVSNNLTYPVVDTGQVAFYSDKKVIKEPTVEEAFFGQDGQYVINQPSYTDNHDGTIQDNITGLQWQQGLTEKLTYQEALQKVKQFRLGGYSDWRIANIKELYSLIQFTGSVKGQKAITPFIDTNYFKQPLGDTNLGEREIDAQVWSSTEYVAKTMNNDETIFGVNFVDGRIKGYPKYNPRTHQANKMYFRFVRGNVAYGKNNFTDNGDGTVTDHATGLTWQKQDSQQAMNWQQALDYSAQLQLGGHDDWRLPNAKELQSIVDYTRSPETTDSAAIDTIFETTIIKDESGHKDYPYFWSSTTHLDGPIPESSAAYVAFGKGLGEMRGTVMDVHGAGAQRSDPKTGKAMSRGPQGDMIRVYNYVRSVRGGVKDTEQTTDTKTHLAFTKSDNETHGQQKQSSQHNRFIKRLDKNGDNRVSSDEFHGNRTQFNYLDTNKDGYISVQEAPTGPAKK